MQDRGCSPCTEAAACRRPFAAYLSVSPMYNTCCVTANANGIGRGSGELHGARCSADAPWTLLLSLCFK